MIFKNNYTFYTSQLIFRKFIIEQQKNNNKRK
nr:MAG TPA: hypothetical protein [Bacteriophage sp.]